MRPRPVRAGSASSGAIARRLAAKAMHRRIALLLASILASILAFLLALGLASAARAQIAPPEVVSRTALPGAWTAPGPAAEAADRTGKRCMASAARGVPSPERTAFVGEVTLTGLIRRPAGMAQRVSAALAAGIDTVMTGPGQPLPAAVRTLAASSVQEALEWSR